MADYHHFCFVVLGELYQLYEPLIGSPSLLYFNHTDGRKRRQACDAGFTKEVVDGLCPSFIKVGLQLQLPPIMALTFLKSSKY